MIYMSHISIFLELTRLKKPIGYMLLFWPCAWGLTIGYNFQYGINQFLFYLLMFFLGSVLMRSAGCIINDIVDKDFDKNVERTKNRPIASGKISIKLAIVYSLFLCFLALLVLINFNKLTILLAISSMPLAFTYPLMKRFTYWPQLFLGITFNYGLLLGWTSINQNLDFIPFIFYFGAIFWTLGYDTIYGAQDIVDDEIIGVKSTSIKFKKMLKKFVFICYSISLIILALFFFNKMNSFYFLIPFSAFALSLYYQIFSFNKKKPLTCLNAFKINNFSGFYLLLTFLTFSI